MVLLSCPLQFFVRCFLIRDTKPLKITFTRCQFFPGLEGKNEIIGMVQAHICRTAPESLVSYGVLFTVLTFHFSAMVISSVLLFIDTFPGITVFNKVLYSWMRTDSDNPTLQYLVPVFPMSFSAHPRYPILISARHHNRNNVRN